MQDIHISKMQPEDGSGSGHRPATAISGIYLLFLSLVFFAISCGGNGEEQRRDVSPVPVDVYGVGHEVFTVEVSSTGELLPMEETEIRSAVGGHVVRIHFREGQFVRAGELLAELDSRRWQAQMLGLEARLHASASELKRREALLRVDGISQADYEQAFADVEQLRSQIEDLKVLIDHSQIRAPFAGHIGLRDFSIGAYIREGDLVTRLVQTDRLRVSFGVPARHGALVAPGQQVAITSSSGAGSATAEVYAVDPGVNRESRSVQARGILNNRDGRFTPGDFVRVVLTLGQDSAAILIPADAIIPELNRQVVFVAVDGRAVRREVVTGARTGDRIQILEGLHPGDMVITTGLMVLRDGSEISLRTGNGEVNR